MKAFYNQSSFTVNPLLSPLGGLLISSILGGAYWRGGRMCKPNTLTIILYFQTANTKFTIESFQEIYLAPGLNKFLERFH